MRRILVVNGPNLNLLGSRHPDTYGSTALSELEDACRSWGRQLGLEIDVYQSNHEGALIDRIHSARGQTDGLVLNPGALTHYSYALHDAIEAVGIPTVEVHISNIEEREAWRRVSVIRSACVYTVYGRGVDGYRWAIRHLFYRSQWPFETISYGPTPDHVFDLRRPDGSARPTPLAVILHGGCWRHEWTRDTTDGIAVDLARRGLTTANLEYQRTGKGGGWPVTLDDVVEGTAVAASLDGIDKERVVLVGHSAGAQLALIAGRRLHPRLLPRLAVSLAGILDVRAAVTDQIAGGAATEFLGASDPEDASPLSVESPSSPVLVAHGRDDRLVPPEYSARYADHLGAELLLLRGDHFTFLDPTSPAWREVADRVVAFVA